MKQYTAIKQCYNLIYVLNFDFVLDLLALDVTTNFTVLMFTFNIVAFLSTDAAAVSCFSVSLISSFYRTSGRKKGGSVKKGKELA